MKKHKDLLAVLKSNELRITPARRVMLQYILDRNSKQFGLKELHDFMAQNMPGVDRSSIYRNLQAFKKLDIIKELNKKTGDQGAGKRFQYIFDRSIHDYFICKACGKLVNGDQVLFKKIKIALSKVNAFSRAGLSVVFYGTCVGCSKQSRPKKR